MILTKIDALVPAISQSGILSAGGDSGGHHCSPSHPATPLRLQVFGTLSSNSEIKRKDIEKGLMSINRLS